MNKLYKWIRLPFQVIYILLCLYQQKRFNQKYLKPIVQPYFKNSDFTLKTEDYTKIFKYYGLAIPAILGNFICKLRGKKMTFKERLLCTYQAALTGVVDDYFDEHNMTTKRLFGLLNNTEIPFKSNEKLGVELYANSITLFHNDKEVKLALERVISSQDLSKKQLIKGELNNEELLDLTLQKGGDSFVFYALYFYRN